jgi:2-keto-4-pentenoate hydratase/2-oxohepta-3-ene-1,7-dioic acid hydratase in catechol pathway
MRLISFDRGGKVGPGILAGDVVLPLPLASLVDYIALPQLERAALTVGEPIPLSAVTLEAPVRPHKNVFCVGRNYLDHAAEIARARGIELKLPTVPTFFTKAPTAIAGPGETLALSAEISGEYDWEAELGVVIGARCRDVPASDAGAVVFGYTCVNDVTARDLQRAHQQWFKGKSLDYTCPVGPWIVTGDDLGDPGNLDITLRVNGVVKQHSNTSKMIFDVPAIIASLSRGLTLEPGDVIATGTPDGVGMARTPPEFLADGDVMEVEIERIGTLRNAVALRPR